MAGLVWRLNASITRFNYMVSTFLPFGGTWDREICPLRHLGFHKDAQSCQSGAQGHPKCTSKKPWRGPPRGLKGTPPDEKQFKKTPKLFRGKSLCNKKCGSWLLAAGIQKDVCAVILAANFTCCSSLVKPDCGYDACKEIYVQSCMLAHIYKYSCMLAAAVWVRSPFG